MPGDKIDFGDHVVPSSSLQLSDPDEEKKKKRLAGEQKKKLEEQAKAAQRQYVGLRFNVTSQSDIVPFENEMIHLVAWARELDIMGFMPYYASNGKQYPAGNLSFRSSPGFVITPTTFNFRDLKPEDLLKVIDCNSTTSSVTFLGSHLPSSETFLHYFIYGMRPDVFSIFYVYDAEIVQRASQLAVPQTAEEFPYGTLELASSVLKVLEPDTELLLVKNQGVISLGKSIDEAGQRILKFHSKALEVGLQDY